MLDKTYQPSELEKRIYTAWEQAGAFSCGPADRVETGAKPYCIMLPPPNVTGTLHMGHALNHTLQDILIRFERMRGRDVLWQPGTDHAGIATQMVVERQLMEKKEPDRRAMGREKFVQRVWDWKAESGDLITEQQRRLGESCDWSRQRFTMDDGMSEAVLKVFVELYGEGLIYKDKRLVNWDPVFQTAISDLEVETREVNGHMWQFAYPLVDGPVDGIKEIIIATTRPETMLGDGAVAVHPSDERYRNLIGKMVRLPIAERHIPIISDEYPDPEFGSGAVKITGAHDFNDFEVARRNNIPLIPLMDTQARMIVTPENNVPKHYEGIDRYEARELVLKEIEELGFYRGVEEKVIAQPFGDRSGVVIEPMLTDQWYVDAETLAKPAIQAVEDGDTVFVPKNWEKTYFEWMRNIQPWCISRQLWWGHRIPAWYGPKREEGKLWLEGEQQIFVAATEDEALGQAREYYESNDLNIVESHKTALDAWDHIWREENAEFPSIPIWRDEDVLDTWFSSALWPFSTLGWPEETPELARYYKTDVLVTGFDIIFFWVARMMMMGLHFMKDGKGQPEVPFHTVYIHALVRDEAGAKMSKSKGNVMDPLEMIDEFGADALRFTLAAMAAQGRDIKLAKSRVEGYRNFGTKLWNASRFLEMNKCVRVEGFNHAVLTLGVNKWIVGEVEKAAFAVTAGIEAYRFNEAAGAIYRFVWNIFCDWYLELIKPSLQGEDEKAKAETRATAAWVLDRALTLLHPFMPFITEELWTRLGETGPERETMLILAEWPDVGGLVDADAEAEFDWVIRVVSEIRSLRAEMNMPAGARIPVAVLGAGEAARARLEENRDALMTLARLESIAPVDTAPKGAVQFVLDEATFALPLEGFIDISAETDRLTREIAKVGAEIAQIDAKLGNEKFISRAPAHVVEEQHHRKADAEAVQEKLNDALKQLKAAS